jgi:hypothetical protein
MKKMNPLAMDVAYMARVDSLQQECTVYAAT